MYEIIDYIEIFIDKGGAVLYAIAFVTFMIWVMLVERFIFLLFFTKELQNGLVEDFKTYISIDSWQLLKIKEYSIFKYRQSLRGSLPLVKTLIVIAPFLGLLGTVSGMIEIFDVMAATGSSDAKSMASGVSRATIPTLAGMVVSISGIFFINLYENRSDKKITILKQRLQ